MNEFLLFEIHIVDDKSLALSIELSCITIGVSHVMHLPYWWPSARLWYLQCISMGDNMILHKAIYQISYFHCFVTFPMLFLLEVDF